MVPTYGEDNFLLRIITLCLSNICIALFYIRIFHIVYLSFCLIREFLGPPPTKTRSGMWQRLAEEPLAAVFRDSPREGKKTCVPVKRKYVFLSQPTASCSFFHSGVVSVARKSGESQGNPDPLPSWRDIQLTLRPRQREIKAIVN